MHPDAPELDEPTTASKKFWSFNAGQLATIAIFGLTVIFGTGIWVSRSETESVSVSQYLKRHQVRLDGDDTRYTDISTRLAHVETDVSYIRESIARIDRRLGVLDLPNKSGALDVPNKSASTEVQPRTFTVAPSMKVQKAIQQMYPIIYGGAF